ncbi:phosphate ABC transporter permease [Fervidicella metallireducens AeB]|uniref:Phosphate transport system permease protein PstA n=1 Tax=Fervidicella metallireducens AeB TaxID=1403537 RepID=A0A017RWS8_9CLOT|nr:phosphate ABC transporter permease PstA [Fervidicella metallireducens]EYE89122.1 phosphate ABC transporter permease [Fervidicella metallireducens AeB]
MKCSKLKDNFITMLFWASGVIIFLLLCCFLFMILSEGLPVLSLDFIFGRPEEMLEGGGIGPEIFNTFYILLLSMLITIPIGLGAGIYLAEYAKDNIITRVIKLSVECLASVPSIVFGLFGMIVFVVKFKMGFSILGGAAALSLLNLPVMVRVTEQAITSVPNIYKEASYALGTTKWQTIYSVILPIALPNIITGINLIAGRAIGESAVLIYTAGTSISRVFPQFNPMAAGETLSVHLWYVKAIGLIPDADRVSAGTAAMLIVIILIFNMVIKLINKYIKRNFEGV